MMSYFQHESTHVIQAEMKRLETRVFIELLGVIIIGALPPMALVIS